MCDIGYLAGRFSLASISDNLAAVNARIHKVARCCGRQPQDISLVAVSKTMPTEAIAQAYRAGQRHFAENFAQEAVAKITALAELAITWHFIGAVQSNKTALLARHFQWVHTVARLKIARRLAGQRDPERPLNVLLQVNIDADPAKSGVAPAEAGELLAAMRALPGLRVRGLMTILEKAGNPDLSFARMRELFTSLQPTHGKDWDTLSMGMTQDMDSAIAHGATHLRIGSAIFGARRQKPLSAGLAG